MIHSRTPGSILISSESMEKMRLDVGSRAPEEACGLVAGTFESDSCNAIEIIPTTNVLHSPVRYRLDPKEQFEAFQRLEALGLELVGIYHSHPTGPSGPSRTDVAEAYYPEVVYLIWSKLAEEWECHGYTIQNEAIKVVKIFPQTRQ